MFGAVRKASGALKKGARVIVDPAKGHAVPKSLSGRYGRVVGGGGLLHRGVRSVIPDGWSKPITFSVGELRELKRTR
jgi:hypothetical protein